MNIDSHKIKIVLAELGLSQAKLAEGMGIARQNLSAILAKGRCTTVTAGKIAKCLGVPVSQIVREDT